MRRERAEELLRDRTAGLQDLTGEYAVLVPLVEGPAGLELLFEVRAALLRRQPGEVCFPGGRMEPGETPEECALRETWEELAIPPEAVQTAAPLDRLLHPSGFLLHPIPGFLDGAAADRARPSPAEVDEVFRVPLDFFLETEPLCPVCELRVCPGPDFPYERIGFPGGYDWKSGRLEVPIYNWEGRPIWGITGRVVKRLAEVLRGTV